MERGRGDRVRVGRKEKREDRGWAKASLWKQYILNSVKDLEWGAKSPDILLELKECVHSRQ